MWRNSFVTSPGKSYWIKKIWIICYFWYELFFSSFNNLAIAIQQWLRCLFQSSFYRIACVKALLVVEMNFNFNLGNRESQGAESGEHGGWFQYTNLISYCNNSVIHQTIKMKLASIEESLKRIDGATSCTHMSRASKLCCQLEVQIRNHWFRIDDTSTESR